MLLIGDKFLNVAQMTTAFHCIGPPLFIQFGLYKNNRSTCINSSYCSVSNTVSFGSARSMIKLFQDKSSQTLTNSKYKPLLDLLPFQGTPVSVSNTSQLFIVFHRSGCCLVWFLNPFSASCPGRPGLFCRMVILCPLLQKICVSLGNEIVWVFVLFPFPFAEAHFVIVCDVVLSARRIVGEVHVDAAKIMV